MKISSQRVLLLGLSIVTALLFAARTQAAQETWSFDPTFQRTPLRVTSESAYALKVLSSGKVLTYGSINGGLLSGANGQRIGALLRIDPNTGAIDPTWNPDPTLTGYGLAGVAEAPDGKIYYSTALVGEVVGEQDDPPSTAWFALILTARGTRALIRPCSPFRPAFSGSSRTARSSFVPAALT